MSNHRLDLTIEEAHVLSAAISYRYESTRCALEDDVLDDAEREELESELQFLGNVQHKLCTSTF